MPSLLLVTGCLGSTVVGEGPLDEEGLAREREEVREENTRRTLAAMSSTGPLFDCTFESGTWPGKTKGSRVTVFRSGTDVTIDHHRFTIERVDKSAPVGGYPSFTVWGKDVRLSLSGFQDEPSARPGTLQLSGPSEHLYAMCAEHYWDAESIGIFDEEELDSLVAATKGTPR